MKKILVLCTGNSCRSQIAEGYLRFFAGNNAKIYSAGIEVHGVNPIAIEVMKEDGIDISLQTSNHIDEFMNIDFDFVITVCDNARESCPLFNSKAQIFHKNFIDPSKKIGNKDEIKKEFIITRDLIKEFCRDFAVEYVY